MVSVAAMSSPARSPDGATRLPRCASYGAVELRRSAQREGGSEIRGKTPHSAALQAAYLVIPAAPIVPRVGAAGNNFLAAQH